MTNLLKETMTAISESGHTPTDIKYAKIRIEGKSPMAKLPENFDSQTQKAFEQKLSKYNYDSGYGLQYVFGFIVFKDGTWLERKEYDGSEWWTFKKCPSFDNTELMM